jgi:hypothetical protein
LRSGNLQERIKNSVGQTCNGWKILEVSDSPSFYTMYNVMCIECGKICEIEAFKLLNNKARKCECKKIKQVKKHENNEKDIIHSDINILDLNSNIKRKRTVSPYENKYSSKYVGVSWDSSKNKWSAQLYYNGKNHKLGCYHNELDAAYARYKEEDRLFGKDILLKSNLLQDTNSNQSEEKKTFKIVNIKNSQQHFVKKYSTTEYMKIRDLIKDLQDNNIAFLDIFEIKSNVYSMLLERS